MTIPTTYSRTILRNYLSQYCPPISLQRTQWAVLSVISVVLLYAFFTLGKRPWHRRWGAYPPGPKGIPIFGNTFQIPLVAPWIRFTEWAAIYGDIYFLSALGMKIVVINSCEIGFDLLHKRGVNYSDRPRMTVIREHGGWTFALSAEPYGGEFHLKRRMINQYFNRSASAKYQSMLADNAKAFACSLLEHPTEFQSQNRMYTGANIMSLTYGHKVTSNDDEWVINAKEAIRTLECLGGPGVHPIDIWPILGKLPLRIWGTKFVRNVGFMKKAAERTTTLPYNIVKAKYFDGTALPSMATGLIEANLMPDGTVKHEDAINGVLAMTYIVMKTVGSLDTFIIAMIHFPEIQREAQQSIDELLQGERLPTFEDRGSLPYVEALYREVLRWKPVLPAGVPHRSVQDDKYQGMFIPAGSMIFFNMLAMMYNPQEFPDPSKFDPGRFLEYDDRDRRYSLRTDVRNPEDMAFGFGRRICPGRHFASAWIWITMATILSAFDILPARDQFGAVRLPEVEYDKGPIRCVFFV
ncbi:cytochrome P450 [Sistotremastrum niveocremeum HHB9708]|uniref:Cytochrome P450 n=1 Tax=Sistotremastrum niveocremeum HHB9708 TaxID=1314777 RepID=A0A164RXF4_9AGAM|nr:cytochrome P450 [Sistotremastrum niveocremeum HHB9708]